MKTGDKIGTATVIGVSGKERKPRPNHPVVPTWAASSSGWWMVAFRVGCRVISEANRRENWSKEHKRKQQQRGAVTAAWLSLPWGGDWRTSFPMTVTMIHHGPKMDTDNLQRAFKKVRDVLAGLLGVDDGDDRVTWQYEQTASQQLGVKVRIEGGMLSNGRP